MAQFAAKEMKLNYTYFHVLLSPRQTHTQTRQRRSAGCELRKKMYITGDGQFHLTEARALPLCFASGSRAVDTGTAPRHSDARTGRQGADVIATECANLRPSAGSRGPSVKHIATVSVDVKCDDRRVLSVLTLDRRSTTYTIPRSPPSVPVRPCALECASP